MIIDSDGLKALKNKVAMVDGGFDPIHLGHIEYFREAAKLGVPVLCCVASDSYVRTKHKPLLSQEQRMGIIDAIRFIDYVCINESTTAEVLEALQPRFYVKGKDWADKLPKAELEICARHGVEIVYLDTVLDSSSRILREYWGHP